MRWRGIDLDIEKLTSMVLPTSTPLRHQSSESPLQDSGPYELPLSLAYVLPQTHRGRAILQRVGAALLLVLASPVIATACFLVRLTSPGPAIYRQVRLGQGGREFTLYKIRTMVVDAEAATGPVWAKPNDPRITALGRILRALYVDELPQLFNVVTGEMELVGPRAERPEIALVLAEEIPDYWERLAVRPGITGLAQINLLPDSDLESVRRKLALDQEYIRREDLWLDARILLATLPRLVGCRGRLAARLLRVHRDCCPGLEGEASSTELESHGDEDRASSEHRERPRQPR